MIHESCFRGLAKYKKNADLEEQMFSKDIWYRSFSLGEREGE